MKRILLICALPAIASLFCFTQCKKEKNDQPNHVGLSITLYDKPLDTIRFYIQGKWKCHYGKGGIVANMIQYYNNYYWTFTAVDSVEQFYNGAIVADTVITWIRGLGTYTNSDSTFIMSFSDKQNVPWVYVVDGIFNDTLILHNNYSDAVFYHFTKSN